MNNGSDDSSDDENLKLDNEDVDDRPDDENMYGLSDDEHFSMM